MKKLVFAVIAAVAMVSVCTLSATVVSCGDDKNDVNNPIIDPSQARERFEQFKKDWANYPGAVSVWKGASCFCPQPTLSMPVNNASDSTPNNIFLINFRSYNQRKISVPFFLSHIKSSTLTAISTIVRITRYKAAPICQPTVI